MHTLSHTHIDSANEKRASNMNANELIDAQTQAQEAREADNKVKLCTLPWRMSVSICLCVHASERMNAKRKKMKKIPFWIYATCEFSVFDYQAATAATMVVYDCDALHTFRSLHFIFICLSSTLPAYITHTHTHLLLLLRSAQKLPAVSCVFVYWNFAIFATKYDVRYSFSPSKWLFTFYFIFVHFFFDANERIKIKKRRESSTTA